MHVLITGGAGFIGSHVVERLLREGHSVDAIDNFDPFYAEAIKQANLAAALACCREVRSDGGTVIQSDGGTVRQSDGETVGQSDSSIETPFNRPTEPLSDRGTAGAGALAPRLRLCLRRGDIRDREFLAALPREPAYDAIIHVAAKAGVRPSILDPVAYQQTNVEGTQNLLEFARARGIRQFVFGSSSSVYGVNPRMPWREDDAVLQPISPYASSKVSGELLGHVYAHLFGIRFIALRFFTVYGPRQRPDLAIHKFARQLLAGRPLPFYGDGSTRRDYTFVDDIVAGVMAALHYTATSYEVINLGNNHSVSLSELVAAIETAVGRTAVLERLPEQTGDVRETWACIDKARRLLGYDPHTPLADGLARFVEWLKRTG